MMHASGLLLAGLVALAAPARAQFRLWGKTQINTTICTWEQPRAAVIRDTVYIDGGTIIWSPGLNDGSVGTPVSDGNFEGLILAYNFSQSFTPHTNVTGLLLGNDMSKARGGSGNANGAAPNYYDGGLLANNDEFFLYGGLILNDSLAYTVPAANDVLSYQAFSYGGSKPLWNPGFEDGSLGDDLTEYIAFGAAVNAPAENMAWYFSGLTSPTHGPIFSDPSGSATMASNLSDTFIALDLSVQGQEKWNNGTLDPSVKPRSNAEVVWVPVGDRGVLVVLGGVVFPQWGGVGEASADPKASEEQSPVFMSTIDVYDVASKKWYKQTTKDGPSTRARGCAVVAPASDASSFNIYYYGGFDGVHTSEAFSDEVWVLSVPSFTWTKISDGTSLHARAGHKCFMPYPDQMMVFGGYTAQLEGPITCLDQGPVVLFNVSSGEWMDSYDPTKHSDYAVPDKVQSAIGGHATGGATATAPAGGWESKALGEIFAKSYDMSKIQTFYPYSAAASQTGRPNLPPNDHDNHHGGSGLPSWVAPVLGVVLGLIVVTSAVVLFCLWRRRKMIRQRGSSEPSSEDAGGRILSWIRGQGAANDKGTVASSEDTPLSPEMIDARLAASSTAPSLPPPVLHYETHEVPDTQIPVELADTSPPNELPDTPLSHHEVLTKHSRIGKTKERSMSNPSYSSFSVGGAEDYSTISRSSAANNSNAALNATHADTPSPEPMGPDSRVVSGVSGLSETQAGHLRNISEVTDGSGSGEQQQRPHADRRTSDGLSDTPVSPPSADETRSEDYLSARNLVSPLRKSVFREEEEDMDKE